MREYRESLDSTRRIMSSLKWDGLLLILTGDLQMRRDQSWGGPIADLAEPLDLKPRNVGIDWIMVDRKIKTVFFDSFRTNRLRRSTDHPDRSTPPPPLETSTP